MLSKSSIIKKIKKLPNNLQSVILTSRKLAQVDRVGIYIVGGFVRDILLGVDNFDLDIVVERNGIGFASKLSKELKGSLTKHRAFGTATVTVFGGLKIDIATSRKESYSAPAVLPVVGEGNIKDDLFRRDFTVNAIACHIDNAQYGEIVDLFGGIEDLKKGRIRFLHELSFIDDPTRIIRAVRFEQRLGFSIERNTLNAIRIAKRHKMLEKVQRHRLRDEIILVFNEKDPYRVMNRLQSLYNLSFIDSKILLSEKSKRVFLNINSICNWFTKNFPSRRHPDEWLMHAMFFFFPLDSARLRRLLKAYAFRRDESIRIISFKRGFVGLEKAMLKDEVSAVKLHSLLDPLSYEVLLLSCIVSKYKKIRQRVEEFLREHHHKTLTITGKDLLAIGVNPGPQFGKIFKAVFRAKINGKVSNREQELAFAKKIIHKI